MAAEFHLAEYALALHFLLQHSEGLVDIVVADENLHAVFLFDRAVNGPDGQGARPLAHGCAQFGCRWHPRYEPTSIESVPADGHHGCQLQEHGDFGTPPSFKQLFGTSQCLPTYKGSGHSGDKEQ
jgi:hypothetical protein